MAQDASVPIQSLSDEIATKARTLADKCYSDYSAMIAEGTTPEDAKAAIEAELAEVAADFAAAITAIILGRIG